MFITRGNERYSSTLESLLSEACDGNLSVLITGKHSLVRFNQQVISYRTNYLYSAGWNPSEWSIIFSWTNLSCLSVAGLPSPSDPLVIPPSISNLTNLKVLKLHGNGIRRPLPSELFSLTQLRYFSTDKMISDQIPLLTRLTRLAHLDLSGSRLRGPFPSCLASLTLLVELDLCSCRLTGPIPPELGQLIFETFQQLSNWIHSF